MIEKKIIENDLKDFSIISGELFDENYILLSIYSDKEKSETKEGFFALIRTGNDNVRIVNNPFACISQTLLKENEEIISISAGGSSRRSAKPPKGGDNEPMIGDFSGKKVYGRTRLTVVKSVDNIAYVVGTRGAVYSRIGQGKWNCIDEDCYDQENFYRAFNDIDGFSKKEIYAVGELGEIWQYNGKKWKSIVSPTKLNLNAIVCASNGKVYIAGEKGTILVGRNDEWELLEGIDLFEFWAVAYFKDNIYLTANERLVYTLTSENKLQLVNFGDCDIPLTAYQLKVRESSLWLFGSKDIRQLTENGEWKEIATLS